MIGDIIKAFQAEGYNMLASDQNLFICIEQNLNNFKQYDTKEYNDTLLY